MTEHENPIIKQIDVNGTTYDICDEAVHEVIDDKANVDGYYTEMTVGKAENLIDINDVGEEFKQTGLRTSCGTQSVTDEGVGRIMKIKGEAYKVIDSTMIRTEGFNAFNYETGLATVLGGNQYQITGDYESITHSVDGEITPDGEGLFTPTNNGVLTITGGNSTNTCVHLTWSGYRNGDFEPYWTETKEFDLSEYFPYGFNHASTRSGGTSYGNNASWQGEAGADVFTPQQAIRRIDRANLKDYTIKKVSSITNGWEVNIPNCRMPGSDSGASYVPCLRNSKDWKIQTRNATKDGQDKVICCRSRSSSNPRHGVIFVDSDYAVYWQNDDVAGLKSAMGDIYVYYLMSESEYITTTFDPPIEITYRVADFGTEEFLNDNQQQAAFFGVVKYDNDYVRAITNLQDRKMDNVPSEWPVWTDAQKETAQEKLGITGGGGGETEQTIEITSSQISAYATDGKFALTDDQLAQIDFADPASKLIFHGEVGSNEMMLVLRLATSISMYGKGLSYGALGGQGDIVPGTGEIVPIVRSYVCSIKFNNDGTEAESGWFAYVDLAE